MSEIIVGIDLGTTNSEIAWLKNGEPNVVAIDGDQVMPSAVGTAPDGSLIVGTPAKNQMVSHPEATILSIKRRMGEEETVSLSGKELRPEEVSALILRELVARASGEIGTSVKKAVITVPAYFNERQRQATKDAGELAGLEVVRIINEPTAAAMAYEAGHEENRTILVYDLGGGTFDASLVVVNSGVVEVKASHGDTKLGGDDFDRLIMERMSAKFIEEHGRSLPQTPATSRRLWQAAEKAKRQLTDHPFARVREEFILEDLHLDIEIFRDEYEEMILPLLRRAQESVHRCLRDASMLPGAVDEIVLVGGSSRTPLVHRILTEDFGKEPRYEVNPDLIVAMGASIQAGMIAGTPGKAVLVDITPYTFGTSALGEVNGQMVPGVYVPVIKRNTPLPTRKSEAFQTVGDNQTMVDVEIFEGEEKMVSRNTFVGNFRIEGLSRAPAGNVVLLQMELDVNGMLKVTAKEKSTGLSKSVTMNTRDAGQRLDLGKARKNLGDWASDGDANEAEFWDVDEMDGGSSVGKKDEVARAKELRRRAEELLPKLSDDDAEEVRSLLEKGRKAIASSDHQALSECNESLSDMIFFLED